MVTGHQQMSQAGSENKCSRSISYECVLKNYNYDDISADQNSICENCKQGGGSASAYGKHSSNVGSVRNSDHVVGVAEVCSREAKSQLQTGASNSFEQSLLQKAWVYLQSIINTHMRACPRCNPRPPPDDESLSESMTQLFLRSPPSATSHSIMSCHRTRPTCSRTISPCHNSRPSCQRAFPPCSRAPAPCPNFESPSSRAKSSKCTAYHKSCTESLPDPLSPKAKSSKTTAYHKSFTESLSDPPSPKVKSSKTTAYHKSFTESPSDPPSPKAKSSKTTAYHKSFTESLSDPPSPKAKSSKTTAYHKSFTESLSDPPSPKAKSSKTTAYHKSFTESPSDPPSPKAKSSKTTAYHKSFTESLSDPPSPKAKSSKTTAYHKSFTESLSDPPSPKAKSSKTTAYHKSFTESVSDPPSPKAKSAYPDAKSRPCSCPLSKTSIYHKDFHLSQIDLPSPNAKPPRLKAMPPHPYYKSSLLQHSVSEDSLSSPNPKQVCPRSKPVCSRSKTCVYHSFSNDSLSSSCKESLVEMAKVYLEKLASDHKIKCRLCAKQCSYYSLETITSYLRGMLEQAWNYMSTPTEQKSSEYPCSQSTCSHSLNNPGILKSPGSTKSKCSCSASKSKFSKPQSLEPEGHPRSITCPTCLTRLSCSKLARRNFVPDPIKHYDDDVDERQEPKFPDRRSEEEGTHEHKSCYTHDCMHNSQSAQPSFNFSNSSCWSTKSYAKPVFIKSRQIKTPQSVEELKASVTGIIDNISGNVYGYDVLDLRSTVEYSIPCEQISKVSKELICLTDEPTPKLVLNLTMEQKDVDSRPRESDHSRESLDICKEDISPCSDLEGQTCKEEALCPNQSCSEESRKSEANHADVIGEESGSMLRKQLSNKETKSKAGHNSMTCIETIQSNRKGKVS